MSKGGTIPANGRAALKGLNPAGALSAEMAGMNVPFGRGRSPPLAAPCSRRPARRIR